MKIETKKVEIEIDGKITEVPINNLTAKVALQLNDLSKKREALLGNKDITNNEALEVLNEMLKVLIRNYDEYVDIIDLIPLDSLEEFLMECIQAVQGKKKVIHTSQESMVSKTKSNSGKSTRKKK